MFNYPKENKIGFYNELLALKFAEEESKDSELDLIKALFSTHGMSDVTPKSVKFFPEKIEIEVENKTDPTHPKILTITHDGNISLITPSNDSPPFLKGLLNDSLFTTQDLYKDLTNIKIPETEQLIDIPNGYLGPNHKLKVSYPSLDQPEFTLIRSDLEEFTFKENNWVSRSGAPYPESEQLTQFLSSNTLTSSSDDTRSVSDLTTMSYSTDDPNVQETSAYLADTKNMDLYFLLEYYLGIL